MERKAPETAQLEGDRVVTTGASKKKKRLRGGVRDSDDEVSPPAPPPLPVPENTCKYCKKLYASESQLAEHIQKRHTCQYCKKKFASESKLTEHIRKWHRLAKSRVAEHQESADKEKGKEMKKVSKFKPKVKTEQQSGPDSSAAGLSVGIETSAKNLEEESNDQPPLVTEGGEGDEPIDEPGSVDPGYEARVLKQPYPLDEQLMREQIAQHQPKKMKTENVEPQQPAPIASLPADSQRKPASVSKSATDSSDTKSHMPAPHPLSPAETEQSENDIFNISSDANQKWLSPDATVIPFLAASAMQHEVKYLTSYIMDCLHRKIPMQDEMIRKLTGKVIKTNQRIHVIDPPTLKDDMRSCQKFADVYSTVYSDQMDMYNRLVDADFYFDGGPDFPFEQYGAPVELGPTPWHPTPIPKRNGFPRRPQCHAFLDKEGNLDTLIPFDIKVGLEKLSAILIQNDFAMRHTDFKLIVKCVRHYLLRTNELRLVELELKRMPKTSAVKKKKSEEELALMDERKQLEADIRLLKKDIGFVAIRSIWPDNTHRSYSHPKGNRELAANQKKSAFHTVRFQLMETLLEKLFSLLNSELITSFDNRGVASKTKSYIGTDFEQVYGSGKDSGLKRLFNVDRVEYQSKLAVGIGSTVTWFHDTYGKGSQHVTLFGTKGTPITKEITFCKAKRPVTTGKFGKDDADDENDEDDFEISQPSTSSGKTAVAKSRAVKSKAKPTAKHSKDDDLEAKVPAKKPKLDKQPDTRQSARTHKPTTKKSKK